MPSATEKFTPSEKRLVMVAAAGTMLALVAFTVPLSTLMATSESLGTGVAGRTWILSSMSIGLGAALLPGGVAGDDFGRRRAMVAGLVVMAVGSVLCAVSGDTLVFVLSRVLQGVGGGVVIAATLGLIAHTFTGAKRGAASGAWGAGVGAGISVGPILSALSEMWVTWRLAYVVLALACLVLAAGSRRWIEESVSATPRGIDVPGAVLSSAGVVSLLAALVEGRQGWGRPLVIVLAVVAVLLLGAFVLVESRVSSPMLDLALFRHRPFVAATAAAFATGAGVIALLSYLGGFVGAAFGLGPATGALLIMAWSLTSVVTALGARRLPARFVGSAQMAFALFGVAAGQLLLTGLTTGAQWWRFLPGLLLAGVATGVLNAALGREAVASVPAGRGGMGSGANNTARYLGSAVGVTLVSVLASRQVSPDPTASLVHGWNLAAGMTAAVSVVGGLVVLLCRARTAPARTVPATAPAGQEA